MEHQEIPESPKHEVINSEQIGLLEKEGKGASGFTKMQEIMKEFHKGLDEIADYKVVQILDYTTGINGLPKSDVLKYMLEKNCSVIVRPGGTEPKLKTYISVSAENRETAELVEKKITEELNEKFK